MIPGGQRADLSASSGDPWQDGLAQLDPSRPATGFSWPAWDRIVAGCRSLLASHGLDLRRLGWSAEDAFGLHRSVPFHGVHAWGLGPLLGDGEVVDLSATGAVIQRRDGSRQSYARRPMPDAVPIWTIGRDPARSLTGTPHDPFQPEPSR